MEPFHTRKAKTAEGQKRRDRLAEQAPIAMKEYLDAEAEVRERTKRLRELRLQKANSAENA